MNREQIKLLKRIKKAGLINRLDISSEETEIIFFLNRNRYVSPKSIPNNTNQYFKITELGKSELYKIKTEKFRFILPIVISAFALIISIAHITLELLSVI